MPSVPEAAAAAAPARPSRARRAVAFAAVALAWLALDALSKGWAEGVAPGEVLAGPFGGLFQLRLVHNTGGAWGLFGSATMTLGVVSIVVCAAVGAFALAARDLPMGAVVGAALLFAGGIGNAIDRFARGYVVDMIDPTFIDFPVFNVADIGVTCGIVLFIGALAWSELRCGRKEAR